MTNGRLWCGSCPQLSLPPQKALRLPWEGAPPASTPGDPLVPQAQPRPRSLLLPWDHTSASMCGAEYGHLHCVLTAIGQLLSLPPSTSYFFHLGLHKQPLTSPGFPDTPCWLRSRTCACADPLSGGPTLPSSPGQPLSGLNAHSSHEPSHALADPVRGPLASTPQLYPVPPALCGRTRKGVCTAASRACPALASTDEGLPGGLSELCRKFHLPRPVYSYN